MKNIVLISFSGVKPSRPSPNRMVNPLNLSNKKAPADGRGFRQPLEVERSIAVFYSVTAEARAAELVVQANEAHVDVLADAIGANQACERDVLVLQEDVVVLDANRPVRGETVLEAGTDRATPTGLIVRGQQRPAKGRDFILAAGDSRTALGVKEDVVPGVADLTGDQTERVDLGAVARREQRADVVAREVSPVALTFDTEHPLARLHAVADLAADRAAGRIVRTLAATADEIPSRMGGTPAAVDADVEAAPVVDRGDHRRRLGVRPRSEVSSHRRCSRAERDKAHSSKQQILVHLIPVPVSSLGPRAVASS